MSAEEIKIAEEELEKLLASKSVSCQVIASKAEKFKQGFLDLLKEEGKDKPTMGWTMMDQEGKIIFADNFNSPTFQRISAAKCRAVVADKGSTKRLGMPESIGISELIKFVRVVAGGKEFAFGGCVVIWYKENLEDKFAVLGIAGYGDPTADLDLAKRLLTKLKFGYRPADSKRDEPYWVPPYAVPGYKDVTEMTADEKEADAELDAVLRRQSTQGAPIATFKESIKKVVLDMLKEEKKEVDVGWVLMDHEGEIVFKDGRGSEFLQKIAAAKCRVVVHDKGSLKRLDAPKAINLRTVIKILNVVVGGKEITLAGCVVIRYYEGGESKFAVFGFSGYGTPGEDLEFAERVVKAIGCTKEDPSDLHPEAYWKLPTKA